MKENEYITKEEVVTTEESNGKEKDANKTNKHRSKKNKNKGKKGNINDASFYYSDKMVAEQINNYSFAQFSGTDIQFGLSQGGQMETYAVPNVMSILVNPSVPTDYQSGGAAQSGITTVGMRNFLGMTMTNSKSSFQYMGNDVTIGILAIGNMMATSGWCRRVLGTAYLFNYRNRAYPEELFEAMRIDVADFRANLASYRVRYNTLMATAQKIPFPANIPYFAKCNNMFQFIYLDGADSNMAQTYLMSPETVWILNETYDSNGSGLDTHAFVSKTVTQTFGWYLDVLESQINALLNSTTLNYVYADVLRLVSRGQCNKLIEMPFIPDDYVVRPVVSDEIALWVHNLHVVGSPVVDPTTLEPALTGSTHWNDVSCDVNKNAIKYNPLFNTGITTSIDWPNSTRLIDFFKENPTLEDKVAATRLAATYDAMMGVNSGKWIHRLITLDWYVSAIQFWRYSGDPDTISQTIGGSINPNNPSGVVEQANNLSKFDWAPLLYDWDGAAFKFKAIIGDLNYYTTMDGTLLRKMYDYEIIGLLEIRFK